jgi:hypothetical protein
MLRRAVVGVVGLGVLAGCSGAEGNDSTALADDADVSDVDSIDTEGDTTEPIDTHADATDGSYSDADASDVASDAGHPDGATACQADVAALGISFTTTAARGVVDALRVHGPIGGVLFASGTDTTPMTDPVACEFLKTLHSFAGLLQTKGFVRVGTLGSYCYRCCCAWSTTNFCRGLTDPEPDCGTAGYSNHSWGRAIDIRYFYKADGTRYDINDPTQWVKYTSTDTCGRGLSSQTAGSISLELYTLACDATKDKIFGTVLTPNYNADHRNHLHMDIGETGTPTSWQTLDLEHGRVRGIDDAPAGEACGDE